MFFCYLMGIEASACAQLLLCFVLISNRYRIYDSLEQWFHIDILCQQQQYSLPIEPGDNDKSYSLSVERDDV